MKQASLKALGVAAVGAVIAVGAAGSASAGTLESVTTTATGVEKALPVDAAGQLVPAGGPVVTAADRAVKSGLLEQAAHALDTALAPHLPIDKLTSAPRDNKGNAGLLGGLPTKAIAPNGISLPGLGTPNIR
ncbi:hypothetical protein [Streptomyces sp. NPDC046261]|uniref:hypothetical protein n=1 Tax=Streptomyces sp. NPDC046261 TaxID=3157200 RepID=UPI0033C29D5B